MDKSVRHFLDQWLMWEGPDHCGWCQTWAGGSGLYKKADWVSLERAIQSAAVFHGLCFRSCPACLSSLTSLCDDWYLEVWEGNPLLPKLLLVMVLYHNNRNLKILWYWDVRANETWLDHGDRVTGKRRQWIW